MNDVAAKVRLNSIKAQDDLLQKTLDCPALDGSTLDWAWRYRAGNLKHFVATMCKELPWLAAEVEKLQAELARRPPMTWDFTAAEKLADEVQVLIRTRKLDPRSPAGDALLDYRGQPSGRGDRLVALERENATLSVEVEKLRSLTSCGVCGGFPNEHPSGRLCICGGSGRAIDEGLNARARVIVLEAERDAALWHLAAARALAERRKKALEPLLDALGHEYPIIEGTPWSTDNCERMQAEAKAAHDVTEEEP